MGKGLTTSAAIGFAAAILLSAAAQAQPVADFYRGKTLRMLIGYGPGGGYDIYGRLVAEFLPRHLPGNPTIITQNMPGAGSFVAAKYMYDVAPKDGTVLGSLAQTLALDSMTNSNAKLDMAKMPYLGRVVTNIDTGAALAKTGIKSFEDVRTKQYNVGASGGGSTTVLFPTALNTYAGAKFKLVRGYSGTIDILLAMERGEVDIVGAYGIPGMLVSHPGWIDRGEATILYQASLRRHRLLPNVPTLPDLAQSVEGREVLRAAASTGDIGRSILTTPGVPAARLAALRSAFQAMLRDPDFLAACEKRNLMVEAAGGEEIDDIVRETLQLSPAVAEKIGQMMK
ncbi:MAG TPA: tripartite tricarboxylate transporter substrate-binding protein [Bradyrhizobium sp.]|nr:tripartite tricarboxylate transporter substrate-binding protein [Bradyrhizobium sp.]